MFMCEGKKGAKVSCTRERASEMRRFFVLHSVVVMDSDFRYVLVFRAKIVGMFRKRYNDIISK